MASRILLKHGTVLLHDERDVVHAAKLDLLIEDSRIKEIGPDIESPADAKVVDCMDKIISPGFIDTHHHVWQTCLKATHANETLLDYFWSGNFVNSLLTPDDVFWGELSGLMECIDSGTTTVVDHATINYSPEHSKEALRASISSGIRSVFAYCPTPRVATWKPRFTLEGDILPSWVMETFDELASLSPFGPRGRVNLGFAFDGLWIPGPQIKELYARVRQAGVKVITSHSVYGASFGAPHAPSTVAILDSHGLLGPDILLSHNNNQGLDDVQLVRKNGVKISSTPVTELQMGQGDPVALDPDFQALSSLGIDCHSVCSAFIPGQMSTILNWERGRRHKHFESHGKWAKDVGSTVMEVFNLGTIQGARSINMEHEVGSLAVGKKADIVIFDATSPGMLVAADRDPIAAVVLHSSIRDIDTVIIDGQVRKESGKLTDAVMVNTFASDKDEGTLVSWETVARRIRDMSTAIDAKKAATIEVEAARKGLMEAFYLNAGAWVDSV